MASAQSTQILLVTRRDPQGPIRRVLRDAGYPVVSANSASAAIRAAERAQPGVIVADPRALTPSGRGDLSSFAAEHDIPLVLGWSDHQSLVAQVTQVVGPREPLGEESQRLLVGSLRVDLAACVAQLGEAPLDLTAREFELLCHFARHPGWVYSRQELLEQVWGYEYGDSQVVTVHIANLRRKVEAVVPGCQLIETVRNIGYRLVVPPVDEPAPAPPPVSETQRSAGERRLVTVLSARVVDFAALSRRLDPEALRDLVSACFERLVPAVERYGGTMDRFSGEEFTAFFGAPRAHENDPERALCAALEMREILTSFNRGRPLPLAVSLGVETGLVYAGGVGTEDRLDYSIIGEAVNAAARLKGAAAPGEILVGAGTYRQTELLFTWERIGSLPQEDTSDPRVAFRLIEARPAASAESGGRPARGLFSPLVGRESELASLAECLSRLGEGEGGIVHLSGEAGMGKSRLVLEARTTAKQEEISWLEGHALSFGRTISYWPLLEILQEDVGIESDDPESERWAKLAARVGSLFAGERSEVLPYLATLLSISLPEELAMKVRFLDGEAMGRQIYRATRLYFARLAQERPTVVVLEDVHWLDGSTASLLGHLLPLTAQAPLLFVLVARPEAESVLAQLRELVHNEHADRLTEIALGPLSSTESALLVRNLADLDEPTPVITGVILSKAEGNPFFVEEILRSLVDLGGLISDPATGRHRVSEDAIHLTIPDTLQGVIMARVDRLDQDLKEVLRLASVVGRSFFYRVLTAIAQAEGELEERLAALEARELILEKARDPELEYMFKHALVQEATYESILLQRRRELHHRVAAVIETLFAERLEEFYSLLAYHFSKAEDWEKAQAYLFRAGDQAGSIAADEEALAHYEEAIEAYAHAFGDRWDPVDRAVLERKMGEAFYRRGDHPRAREYLYRALAMLGTPYPTSPRAERRAVAGQVLVQFGHRLFSWLSHRALTPEALRAAWERQRIYLYVGWMDVNTSREFLDALVGLNAAESAGIESAYGWYAAMGLFCDLIPLRRASRYYHERCARGLEREWDTDSREELILEALVKAVTYMVLGGHEYWTGEWTKAVDYLRSARRASSAVGDSRTWSSTNIVLSDLLIERGEMGKALDLSQEAIAFGQESGDRVAEAWARMEAGQVLFAQGALEEAEAQLRRAAQQLLASLDLASVAKANARIAHCYLRQGRLEEAQTILTEEANRLQKSGARGYFTRDVRTGNAFACLLALEQATEAEKGGALKDAKSACRDLLEQGRSDAPALVSAYRMQGTFEWLRGRPGKAEDWWRRSLEQAERLGAHYEEALTRLEIGKRTGDRNTLETAEAAFAQMGAQFDRTQARELLDGMTRV